MAKDYQDRLAQANRINRERGANGRDIGCIPAVVNPERKEACRYDFKLFCETYFPNIFNLEWSPDHLIIIEKIERAVLEGGLFAMAMPRGQGKTSICLAGNDWAILYGHRRFVVLIGASEDAATDLLDNVKTDIAENDLLLEDFPEVCYPIRCLDGIIHRAMGQTCNGTRTQIDWTAKQISLPIIEGSQAAGAVCKVAGITGRIRGMISKSPTGETIRPDLVLIDDPQTDESAKSPKQVEDRLSVVGKAILGLAGPGQKIAGVMPVTVIVKNDMADQVLDRKKFPHWQGERKALMPSAPTNHKLWEEYDNIRREGLAAGRGIAEATTFYVEHKSDMDAGAVVSWQARYEPDEASAIQNAMNLKLTDPAAFQSEYQNEPVEEVTRTVLELTPEQIQTKFARNSKLARCIVPAWATKLTSFIDIQGTILYYAVVAWGDDFSGHVIEYGTFPKQHKTYFTLRDIDTTLQKAYPKLSSDAALYQALTDLTDSLFEKKYKLSETGGTKTIDRLLIDANWGATSGLVKKFCFESKNEHRIIPSHGRAIRDKAPISTWHKGLKGVRKGWQWIVKPSPDHHIAFDVDAFKTFLAQRLLSSDGDAGNLTIHHDKSPAFHKGFVEHLLSEKPHQYTNSWNQTIDVWKLSVGRDNHWLDCMVGCAVAASEQGIKYMGHQQEKAPVKKKRGKIRVHY